MQELLPNYAELVDINTLLNMKGFCVLNTSKVIEWTHCSKEELDDLSTAWAALPSDKYLKDGGHYRRRRPATAVMATIFEIFVTWQCCPCS